MKIIELFAGHPFVEEDLAKAMRVSRYLGDTERSRHVRSSVWSEATRRGPRRPSRLPTTRRSG